jgi:hypothetical protein
MGNSRTSRYADGKQVHDLASATATWLRVLAQHTQFELVAPRPPAFGAASRRFGAKRFGALRSAVTRAPMPSRVSVRRGAGEVQRVLMDPEISRRLRKIAKRHGQDEGDVASMWASTTLRATTYASGFDARGAAPA